MKSSIWIAALLLVVGCDHPVSVVTRDDAGIGNDAALLEDASIDSDATTSDMSISPRCEVLTGAAWERVDSPALVPARFRGHGELVATHDGETLVPMYGAVYFTDGSAWTSVTVEGLPSMGAPSAVHWYADAWWLAYETGASEASVYRWSEGDTSWTVSGHPPTSIKRFYSNEHALLGSDRAMNVYRWDASSEEWVASPVLDFDFAWGMAATDSYFYLRSERTVEDAIIGVLQRSTDGRAWEELFVVPDELNALSLVGGSDFVLLTNAYAEETVQIFRESDEEAGLQSEPIVDDVVPVWIGEDGTVLGRPAGGALPLYAADELGAAWTALSSEVSFESVDSAIDSDGSRIVIVVNEYTGLGPSYFTKVLQSTDHGRSWGPLVDVLTPSTIYDIASDGATMMVRSSGGDDSEIRDYRLEADGTWTPCTAPDRTSGMSGVGNVYITRPGDYAVSPPYFSVDHGATWNLLNGAYPGYDSNAGAFYRRVGDYAMDANGYIYAGTLGGTTSIPGTGSKVGWGYRPGSGIWRREDANLWHPVNAGIPIEFVATDFGGAPFRTDVQSLAIRGDEVFAYLAGRGVYELVADRWMPNTTGLPVGESSMDLIVAADELLAWDAHGAFALSGNVWLPRIESPLSILASRDDLLVRVDPDGVSISYDAGRNFSALPALSSVSKLTLSNDAIYAVDTNNVIHSLAIACSEGL